MLARVHCYVPGLEVLFSCVTAIMKTFGPLKDLTTRQPLFNKKAWDVTKNILGNICGGYYLDPPGVVLCYEVGKDKDGLILYHCCHGTNDLEGRVHQNIICCFPFFNASSHCSSTGRLGVQEVVDKPCSGLGRAVR